jgi:hypothetical protein
MSCSIAKWDSESVSCLTTLKRFYLDVSENRVYSRKIGIFILFHLHLHGKIMINQWMLGVLHFQQNPLVSGSVYSRLPTLPHVDFADKLRSARYILVYIWYLGCMRHWGLAISSSGFCMYILYHIIMCPLGSTCLCSTENKLSWTSTLRTSTWKPKCLLFCSFNSLMGHMLHEVWLAPGLRSSCQISWLVGFLTMFVGWAPHSVSLTLLFLMLVANRGQRLYTSHLLYQICLGWFKTQVWLRICPSHFRIWLVASFISLGYQLKKYHESVTKCPQSSFCVFKAGSRVCLNMISLMYGYSSTQNDD